MANTLRTDTLVCVDLEHNNNKSWRITQYDDNSLIKEWGRIDENGVFKQNKRFSFSSKYSADKEYDDSVSAKLKGKSGESVYTRAHTIEASGGEVRTSTKNNTNLVEIATRQIVTNNPETMELVKILTVKNIHNIENATAGKIKYNASTGFTTPLGVVTPSSIVLARQKLDSITNLLDNNRLNDSVSMNYANDYLRIVPQDFGRARIQIESIFGSHELIAKQVNILDSLEASFATMSKPVDGESGIVEEPIFDAKLFKVDDASIIDRITKKYYATLQTRHMASVLKPKRIFSVEIGPMHKQFLDRGIKVGNVMELWHGTKINNLLSILKSGLKIAPPSTASVAGKNFGQGLYYSDQSTKSLNYAYGYWGSSGYDDTCYMLLVQCSLGKMYPARTTYSGYKAPSGYDSLFCEGGKCSGLLNNEYVVYEEYQSDPVFLIEFCK